MKRLANYLGVSSSKPLIILFSSSIVVTIFLTLIISSQISSASSLPDFTGQNLEQVKLEAEESDVEITFEWVDSNQPQGEVTSQKPPAGSPTFPGATIRIFVSKGPKTRAPNESKNASEAPPTTSEQTTQNGTSSLKSPQTNSNTNSGRNVPPQVTPNIVNPPDPTRPWLTQADIDQNRAEKATLLQQISSLESEIVGIQQCVSVSAADMQRYRIGGPEDNMTLWADAMQRNSNCRYELDSNNSDLNVLYAQLNSRDWY